MTDKQPAEAAIPLPLPQDRDLRLKLLAAHVQSWVSEGRAREALTREALGKDAKTRSSLLRNAPLLQSIRYYRRHKAADIAPGIFLLVCALADNDKGALWVRQKRIAQLFGRKPEAVSEAIKRLRQDGDLLVESRDGRSQLLTPAVALMMAHLRPSDILDILAPVDGDDHAERRASPPVLDHSRCSDHPGGSSGEGRGCPTTPPIYIDVPKEMFLSSPPAAAAPANGIEENKGHTSPSGPGRATSKVRPPKNGTTLPADWSPDAHHRAWVSERYIATEAQVTREAEKFRDYHCAKGTLSKDWHASWRTWWRNGYHKIPERPLGATPSLAPAALPSAEDLCKGELQRALKPAGMLRIIAQRQAESGGRWPEEHLGPPPGKPGCIFPPEVIAALKDQTHAGR